MKRFTFFLTVALIASLTAFCGMAFSQPVLLPTITFDDTSETMAVTVDNDPTSVLKNMTTTTGTHQSVGTSVPTTVEFAQVGFDVADFFSEPASGNATVVGLIFTEPGSQSSAISDVATVSFFVTNFVAPNTHFDVTFESDYLGNSPVPFDIPNVYSTFLETAAGQSLTFEAGGDEVFTLQFNSDVTEANVPEPSTLLLLGAGLAGVGLLRRRFKK